MSTVSITDHDTFRGYREALPHINEFQIRLVPGIELSTAWHVNGRFQEEIHVLWYGADTESNNVIAFEQRIKESQNRRIERVLDLMKGSGLVLDSRAIICAAEPAPACVPHIVFHMIERGYLPYDFKAIEQFVLSSFSPGGAFFLPPALDTADAIGEISALGGSTVLAHPGKIANYQIIDRLLQSVDGVEICHPSHSPEQVSAFRLLATERNLHCTAGTDFHGYYEPAYSPIHVDPSSKALVERFAAVI